MRRYSQRKFRKKFQVEITETLQRIVDVMAYTAEDAITQVTEKYRAEEIVLDTSDFIDYNIGIWK